MFYSYNSKFPKKLPEKIYNPDGSFVLSSELSDEQLLERGFAGPYEIPEHDPWTQILVWNGEEFFLDERSPYETYLFSSNLNLDSGEINLEGLKNQLNESEDDIWDKIKSLRNKLLCDTDYIDRLNPEPENIEEWNSWRQYLRDLTEIYSDPLLVEIPEAPLTPGKDGKI
jgi:hypothetical protein